MDSIEQGLPRGAGIQTSATNSCDDPTVGEKLLASGIEHQSSGVSGGMATTKKSPAKKSAAKKASATKATAKKAAKKTVSKTQAAKKATTKKVAAKKATAKKQPVKKKPAGKKKSASKKPPTNAAPRDAIAILKADHRRVTDLFDKFESLGDRAHKSRETIVEQIIEELAVHAGIEEAVLYPALRERFAASEESDVLEALEEHHVVKLLLAELQSMPSESDRYTAKVTVLREIVDHHVDEEEDELFKQVRREFSRSELVELGDELTAARASAPTRPHPSAPDTPPGNIVANVLAAPLDAATGITTRAAGAVRDLID